MKKFILASAILLFTHFASAATGCESLVPAGIFPISKTAKQTILCKNGFVIGYSPELKTPLWVAEKLDSTMVSIIKQRTAFHKDASVDSNKQPSNADYASSGYDKGHMASFEDMSFSEQSAIDSMSLTNVVPQNLVNNRGGWKALEMYARSLAKNGTVYVISGPIFEGKTDYIGNQIPIPTKLFKVIMDIEHGTSMTFILPNEPVTEHDIPKYLTTRSALNSIITISPSAKLNESGRWKKHP